MTAVGQDQKFSIATKFPREWPFALSLPPRQIGRSPCLKLGRPIGTAPEQTMSRRMLRNMGAVLSTMSVDALNHRLSATQCEGGNATLDGPIVGRSWRQ